MTALRVVTDHQELENSGSVTHAELDSYVNTTPFVIASGVAGAVPPNARRLKAGPGINIVDTGTELIVSASAGTITQWMELPTGVRDGANKDFVLAFAPSPAAALMFFINGVLQEQGADSDYNLVSGNIVHVNYNYRSGSNMRATYPY